MFVSSPKWSPLLVWWPLTCFWKKHLPLPSSSAPSRRQSDVMVNPKWSSRWAEGGNPAQEVCSALSTGRPGTGRRFGGINHPAFWWTRDCEPVCKTGAFAEIPTVSCWMASIVRAPEVHQCNTQRAVWTDWSTLLARVCVCRHTAAVVIAEMSCSRVCGVLRRVTEETVREKFMLFSLASCTCCTCKPLQPLRCVLNLQ